MLKSPIGTLTFLMTDIEGSTRLWEDYPAAMTKAIPRSESIIHEAVTARDGYHVVEQGEGDSTLSVFKDASQAILAAKEIRERLAVERWSDGLVIRVRIGIHSGVADMRQQTYYGRVVNRAARVRAVAHGGQIVLTRATKELLAPDLGSGLVDHGQHRLKDLLQPEHLFELAGSESFPPFRTLSALPNNLPVQLTPFIGRGTDIEGVVEKLAGSRLVTLLGPGGCGKTRLALQIAADHLDRYTDGAFFVDLSSIRTAEQVTANVLHACGAEDLGALSTAEMLVVIDNCEHIAREAALAIKELLSSSHHLKVLATSRGALHLHAESIHRVQPFGLPAHGRLSELDHVAASEAVQFFVERAEAKIPEFKLTPENCRSVGELCIHLDGIALAIELAVPRLKLLSPADLLKRLGERFELLRTSDPTESERHHTLRAAIEYSYDLLSKPEKQLLHALAVFRGNWAVQAAEAVAPDNLRASTLELLESLYDKSLITTYGGSIGDRAYLLESIRAFALAKLAADPDSGACYARLADWSIHTASAFEDRVRSGESQAASLLQSDLANFEGALDWTIEVGDADGGIRLAESLWRHWSRIGSFTHAREQVRKLLSIDGIKDDIRALGCNVLGILSWYQGDLEEATKLFDQSLTLYTKIGDEKHLVKTANNLGLVAAANGNFCLAREHLRSALERARRLQDSAAVVMTGNNLGMLELDAGRAEQAYKAFVSILPSAREVGDQHRLSIILINLAESAMALGRYLDSGVWIRECAPFFTAGVLPASEAAHFCLLGASLLCRAGNSTGAAVCMARAKELLSQSGVALGDRDRRLYDNLDKELASQRPVLSENTDSAAIAALVESQLSPVSGNKLDLAIGEL